MATAELPSLLPQSEGELSLISAEEREQVLVQFNDTERAYPGEVRLHELFERQVAKTPSAIALVFGEQKLSYAELNRKANQLGHYLRKLGVGPEVLVAICLERSLEMMVAVVGILKAGGAYLPLDPAYPPARLAFMLADAKPEVLLTAQTLMASLPQHEARVIGLDTDWHLITEFESTNVASGVSADNPAYVIYTSGSTGQPKGVVVCHRGLSNLYTEQARVFRLGPGSRVLQFASLSFDPSVFEAVTALTTGATLVMASKDALLPGPPLLKILREQAINLMTLPPSALSALPSNELPALRALIVGGEPCSGEVVERWAEGRQFFNAYGPTEATIWASIKQCHVAEGPPSIGKPIGNVEMFVLDRMLQPVPIGAAGELYIGGAGLARGYLNRPELTAERFIPHPFCTRPGARLYDTGDLARYHADGNIQFLGRVDHQVKLRGYRIELGEVEAVLGKHEQLSDVVVMARAGESGEQRLVAYVVRQPGSEVSSQQLRQYLKQRLPEYMVPSAYVMLEQMPLMPNRKVDRRALPAPDNMRPELEQSFVAPHTQTEELLAGIWADVLGLKSVGVNDSFFDLGGHSLSSTQVISRIRETFQVELPMRLLFEDLTVAQIARQIENASLNRQDMQPGVIEPIAREGSVQLSLSQERAWFIQQMTPTNRSYNAHAYLRFSGVLDVPVLEKCLNEIVRRHEIFRTTFPFTDGQPVQLIHAASAIALPLVDLQDVPESERAVRLEQLIQKEGQHTFDLEQLPLVRWKLFRLSKHEHVLSHLEHHIVHDGWSFNVFLRELNDLYTAYCKNEVSPLAELPIQFADFAQWQRKWMHGEEAQRQLAYWKQKLTGSTELLELPYDRPRPAVQTHAGATQWIELPAEMSRSLLALARQERATLFMTLLAAFQTLLYRYSGQDDIKVGTGIANRRWQQSEALMGMLLNNLVLRTDFSGDPTFQQLLKRVKGITLDALGHQDIPFDKVVDVLRPKRDPSYNPLFQVMLSFHDARTPEMNLPGLDLSLKIAISNGSSKFDMNLTVVPHLKEANGSALFGDDGITVIWEYNTDLFDAATIQRLAEHYQILLASIVASPEQRVSELPMLSEAERRQLLVQFNDTEREYPPQLCLHQLFEAQAELNPQAIALVFEEQELSYGELNVKANTLAHYLRQAGVGPEVVVGVCLERSIEMVVALLAILKAGGAYLPLDPDYPQERLAFMLGDAMPPVLLATHAIAESLPAHDARVICLDDDQRVIAESDNENVVSGVSADNPAYVIYTSGSTGQPKGAIITHRGICNRLLWMQEAYGLTGADHVLQKTPFSFDVSVWEFFWPLSVGARLVVARPGGHRDNSYLMELIERQRISTLHFVPSMLQAFLEQPRVNTCRSLKRVICSGEALSLELQARFFTQHEAELHNLYGPTEASVDVTFWACRRNSNLRSVPIGRPIANTQLYLLDGELQPVPIGVAGELYIGGVGLGRGYLKRPALTAERFIPDPFCARPGARLYHTGDLARYQADGNIEFLGRVDHQVKLRGYRIELGEVETVLGEHQQVSEVIVLALAGAESGEQRLVAYVVKRPGGEVSSRELREYLKQRLPEYMIPSAYVMLEQLPLTANGKVDRRALPAPESARIDLDGAYLPPQNGMEQAIAGVWQDVLQVEKVGRHNNFFDLGGHSLLLMRVRNRLEELFAHAVTITELFKYPTVNSLAEHISQQQSGSASSINRSYPMIARPQVGSDGEQSSCPLSFSQQRLWFLDQLEPGNPFYNMSRPISFHGSLDVRALAQSLKEIIRRHEALRTTFAIENGEPVQVIAPAQEFELSSRDLSGMAAAQQEEQVRQLIAAEAAVPFDLGKGPLVRSSLLRLGESEHVLLLTMHHIVCDGWSLGILFRELSVLYEAYRQGEASPLAELAVQYADYALWQREWLQGAVLEQQLKYWREQLAGMAGVLELPSDRVRPAVQSYRGARQKVSLTRELTRELKQLSQQAGVTMYMTLLAGFTALLSRYSGQEEIVVGSPNANRTRAEVEGLIGFFVNTLVLRTELSGEPTFSELLQRVKEVCIGAYSHQDMPFEKLVEELEPERSLSHNPLFQVMFTFQNDLPETFALPNLSFSPLTGEGKSAIFDLTVVAEEQSDELHITLQYNTDLFDAATIERLGQHYQRLLQAAVANPEQRVAALPLLNAAEREQLLLGFNDTQIAYPQELCLQQLFEAQAAATPQAIALIFEAEQVSYAELNRRANQLAHYLRRLGVGPEVLVGICLERGVAMVVALLAILKAGGAYLPLDPAYPVERLSFMLADAGVTVLVTEQALRAQFGESAARAVCLDVEAEAIRGESVEELANETVAENLAYVMYTSGSTGQPKGVAITHRNVVRLVKNSNYAKLGPEEVFLQLAPISFDASTFELWGSLLNGARLVIMPPQPPSLEALGAALRSHQVTTLWLTAGLFHLLVEQQVEALEGVRQLLAGGDVLSRMHVTKVLEQAKGCTVINGYGPTESTTFTCSYRVESSDDIARSVPIGKPIANTEVYILDQALQPVPLGVSGELYIGGAGLGRGYLKRPELTAERFIPDGLSGQAGTRLYQTGDLARYQADGNIEFLGRMDQQVKLRGYRIELGEIEAVLSEHQQVSEVVVVARTDESGEQRLAAYVVGQVSSRELREYLKQRLPDYMIPSAYVMLEQLPLTANGKVDRRALPEAEPGRGAVNAGYVAARTPVEGMMASLWSELLGVNQIGINDNFFDLGGHSLGATQLISRVRTAFHIELPLRSLFEMPTISGFSEVLEQAMASQVTTPISSIVPGLRKPRRLRS
jgi:amino acid adenylation domain-containing protein